MPVFVPNDYFFNKYQIQGEEKWETYARTLRELMAQESELKLSDF